MKWFKQQRGAMFSMDARVALLIGSILAGTIGVQAVQKIQSNRIELAEVTAIELIKALENYTADHPSGPYPGEDSTATADFTDMVLDGGYGAEASLTVDPWGNNWVWDHCLADVAIDGVTVPVYYAIVHSNGPDGQKSTGYNNGGDFLRNTSATACRTDFGDWQPLDDDIGAKFSNFEQQRQRVAEYRRRTNAVMGALQAYEGRLFLENQRFCNNSANHSNRRCNWNIASGTTSYDPGEEAAMNYFPEATTVSITCANTNGSLYYSNHAGLTPVWVPNNTAATTALLNRIGLSQSYSSDPWGRPLCYYPNTNCSCRAPFVAAVSYATSCPARSC